MQLSFQLYTARDVAQLDPLLDLLVRRGIYRVEGWDAIYGIAGFANSLSSRNMTMPSAHMSLADLKDRDRRQQVAREFGVSRFIVPGIAADRISSRDGCLDVGRELLELSQQMKAEGLRLGWHNSGAETTRTATRERPIDLLLEFVPELEWECDLGWLASAGLEPATELRTQGNRITALHMRDVAGPDGDPKQQGGADIGSGVLEWEAIRAALKLTRVDLLVMEHDHAQDVPGFLNRSTDFLLGWMTPAATA